MSVNSFIYKWFDSKTNKIYIGVHKGTADDGYICSSKYMMEEYKRRPHDFVREILEYGTYKDCQKKETELLKKVSAANNALYYNQSNGRETFYHLGPHSEATKLKISKTEKGKIVSAEIGRKISLSLRGKKNTTEQNLKISVALKGKKHTEEQKRINSLAHMGHKHSVETKQKMRNAKLGRSRNFSILHRKNLSEAMVASHKRRKAGLL